jgi:hypothetical protein
MGLGKSLTIIALIAHDKIDNRIGETGAMLDLLQTLYPVKTTLVVVPPSRESSPLLTWRN